MNAESILMIRAREEEVAGVVVVSVVVVADLKETTFNLHTMTHHSNNHLKRVRLPKDPRAPHISEEDVEEDNLSAILAPEDRLLENSNDLVEGVPTGENLVVRVMKLLLLKESQLKSMIL